MAFTDALTGVVTAALEQADSIDPTMSPMLRAAHVVSAIERHCVEALTARSRTELDAWFDPASAPATKRDVNAAIDQLREELA